MACRFADSNEHGVLDRQDQENEDLTSQAGPMWVCSALC